MNGKEKPVTSRKLQVQEQHPRF